MAEETVVTNEVHEDERITNSLYWPETQIGQTVFVNCTCGNVTIARASRFCGGDVVTGATWENPDDSACTFTNTVKDICQLVTADVRILAVLNLIVNVIFTCTVFLFTLARGRHWYYFGSNK